MWLLRRSQWAQQVNMMSLLGCSDISPCEWAFFSWRSKAITPDRKCSFPPQADSHYLAVSAVCAWCDFTNLFIFIPRTARRRFLQVHQPTVRSVISFMIYCNLFPFMLQTASPSPLSHCVQTVRWVSCHGYGMLCFCHLQTFGVFQVHLSESTRSQLSQIWCQRRGYISLSSLKYIIIDKQQIIHWYLVLMYQMLLLVH